MGWACLRDVFSDRQLSRAMSDIFGQGLGSSPQQFGAVSLSLNLHHLVGGPAAGGR